MDGLLSQRRNIGQTVQDNFGLLANQDRGNVLPVPDGQGGVLAPQWLYEMAKAVSLPGHVMRGGDWSPEDVTNMALTVGGSAGAASMAGGVPKGALGANVWHGSPHKYGPDDVAKSLDHIGKGEGAQAYGWGRYDAGARDVAEQYKLQLTTSEDFVDGVPFDAFDPKHLLASELGKESGDIGEVSKTLKMLSSRGGTESIKDTASKALALLNDGARPIVESAKPEGQLYKLDLPDEDIARYMDWDKPLSEQPESVRLALEGLLPPAGTSRVFDEKFFATPAKDGGLAYKATGGDIYRDLASAGQKQFSEALGKAGIPGLKYLDGMSRDAGRGSHNYVTWDQDVLKRMKMLQRNDETFATGSPAGLLAPREEKKKKPPLNYRSGLLMVDPA